MGLLVVGASGLLGSNVVSVASERGLRVAGTYRSAEPEFSVDGPDRAGTATDSALELFELELPDVDGFRAILDAVDPTAVVNCAATTDVDQCERSPDRARAVNEIAAREIAETCARRGIPFLHVSTDYVFDGTSDTPYRESEAPTPRQQYGETKLAGEEAVRAASDDHFVVRPSFIWGVHRVTDELTGFAAWVEQSLRDGESVSLYTDQRVTPSRARSTAATMLDLLDSAPPDTYHVACRSCVTPYEFGDAIRRQLDEPEELLESGSIAAAERDAPRPVDTCLAVYRVESTLGRRQPTLTAEIEDVFEAR